MELVLLMDPVVKPGSELPGASVAVLDGTGAGEALQAAMASLKPVLLAEMAD